MNNILLTKIRIEKSSDCSYIKKNIFRGKKDIMQHGRCIGNLPVQILEKKNSSGKTLMGSGRLLSQPEGKDHAGDG